MAMTRAGWRCQEMMLHPSTWKTHQQAGGVIPISCWSATWNISGQQPSLLVFIAVPCPWLAIMEPRSAPVQGAQLCFLTERGLADPSAVAAFPARADSQPRASRNELPTASCWETARTGLLTLPGRQSAVHEKGSSEHCVSKNCPPSGCSLRPAMGRRGPL